MDYWYSFASPGPRFACTTSSGTVPVFDTDTTRNNTTPVQDLTPLNRSYSCTTQGGRISWNNTTQKLTINGTVFIDGSAMISAGAGTYDGVGTIVLSGIFSMDNQTQMCAISCDANPVTSTWNPNTKALIIVAAGADGSSPPNSINMKKAAFEGGLIGYNNIPVTVSGSNVIGPVISVTSDVTIRNSSGAAFPPINFAPSGTGGITQPLPPGMLLSPRNYAGG